MHQQCVARPDKVPCLAALQANLGLNSSIEIGQFDAYAASLYEEADGVTNGPGSFMLQVQVVGKN